MSNPDYRVLVFLADGEVTGVYLVPESEMGPGKGMDRIHDLAHNQEIRILNMIPSVADNLAQVIEESSGWGRGADEEDEV